MVSPTFLYKYHGMNRRTKMGMKLVAIMAAVLFTVAISFSWYYKDTQKRMVTLVENSAKFEVSALANEAALIQVQEDAVRMVELNRTLQADLQRAEQYGDDLRMKLIRHDLTLLALKKPGLIEQRINDATQKLFDDISADTNVTP
jgi:hypothetical protein